MPCKVSIQIPTYNQQQYILRAIESALMQDYPNLEIIVADDCSTDDTEAIVRKIRDNRIKYIKNEKNIGRVANYRKSLYENCIGDWVVNLDGDDYYSSPSFISRGMRLIQDYQQAGHQVMFYQAAIQVIDEITGKSMPKYHALLTGSDHGIFEDYYLNGYYRQNKFFSHLTTIYNRKAAIQAGFYEYNTLNTDFESMMKLSFFGDAILDNHVAGVWRLHNSNATFNSGTRLMNNDYPFFDRFMDYARAAYGNRFTESMEKKLKHENQVLHLELLAENDGFFTLLKHLLKYHIWNKRTPVMIAKSLLRNIKKPLR